MSQHVLSYLITVDGSKARAEIKGTKGAHDQLKSSALSAGQAEDALSAELREAAAAARAASGSIDATADAHSRAATQARAAAGGYNAAAGQVGNLTAQFNDIGMMLMAGQNPLQLAVQQGTQITQVIGPMGAAGAARSLGAAFVSMMNPVSLVTIGSIAAGAMMVQWLTGADEDARTAAEAIADLGGSISDYRKAVQEAVGSTDDLWTRFGDGAEAGRETLERLADAKELVANMGLQESINAMLDETRLDLPRWDIGDQQRLGSMFGIGDGLLGLLGNGQRENRQMISAVLEDYTALSQAAEGSIEEQLAAVEALYQSFRRAAEASGEITTEENAQLQVLAEISSRLLEQKAISEIRAGRDRAAAAELQKFNEESQHQAELSALIAQHGADSAEVAQLRIQRERELLQVKLDQLNVPEADKAAALDGWEKAQQAKLSADAQSREASEAARLAAIRARDAATAQRMLADLEQQNRIMAAIAAHGEDSAQVAQLRTSIERDNMAAMLDELDVAEDIKDAIRAAWQEGQTLNATDMSAGISQAAAAARELAGEVAQAVSNVQALQASAAASINEAQIRLDHVGDAVGTARALGEAKIRQQQAAIRQGASPREILDLEAEARAYGDQMAQLASLDKQRSAAIKAINGSRRSGGGGRGSRGGKSDAARAHDRERQAVEQLIGSLRQELDVLREKDPVEREMIRHCDAMKGATDKEREAIRELIATRRQEEAAIQSLTDRQEAYRDIAYDAFEGLLLRGESLNDVLADVASALAKAALQAALLGQGPLAGLFGTTPGVGLLNMIFPSPVGLASGGPVYGPGSGTSDSVPAFLSAGEFVVNAAAAKEHRALLEMVNSGGALRMAQGGIVPPVPRAPTAISPIASAPAANAPAAPGTGGGHVTIRVVGSPLLQAQIVETSQNVTAELLDDYDRNVAPGTIDRVSNDSRRIG